MNFSNTVLKNISLHAVGNKTNEQELVLSTHPLSVDKNLSVKLRDYFLNRFPAVNEKYQFSHPSSLKYNEVFSFVAEAFSGTIPFHTISENIAKHLFEASTHPKIQPGELYVCSFENCLLDNQPTDAIGIFKTETKSGFFEIDNQKGDFKIEYKEGVDINKFDKGCLIFNTDKAEGFQVYIIDNQNRGEEAQYWRELFLGLKQTSNEFKQTKDFLTITKNFVTKQLVEEYEVSKADQIDLLNRSVAYFKTHDKFEKEDFEKEVFQDTSVIKSFRTFDESYKETNELELADSFEISSEAVKKQAKVFKSVLKLDKNFHIYIHGDKELIEQGVDKDGRKYYKIYFDKES